MATKLSRDEYLASFSHDRKRKLAEMLLDGTTQEELEAESFGRLNTLEMATDIKKRVDGMDDFTFEYVETDSVTGEKKSTLADTQEDAQDASSPVDTSDGKGERNPVSGSTNTVNTVGGNPVGTLTGEEDEATLEARRTEAETTEVETSDVAPKKSTKKSSK